MADRLYHVASFLISVVVWTGENDSKTISVDANLFENGLVWTGPKAPYRVRWMKLKMEVSL